MPVLDLPTARMPSSCKRRLSKASRSSFLVVGERTGELVRLIGVLDTAMP